MVFINYAAMQLSAKIVYYGPGLCGKTTSLQYIYKRTAEDSRGELVSLDTETDRTLFFDLLPMEVGVIGGFKTKIQLYTVPGQVFYNTTRKLVLRGVDGIVFVADSQEPLFESNIESYNNLHENLRELNLRLEDIPLVFQYNKRDLKNVVSVDKLNEALNKNGFPCFETSATTGQGVFDALKGISKLTLLSLKSKVLGSSEEKPSAPRPQAPRMPSMPVPARPPQPAPRPAPAAPPQQAAAPKPAASAPAPVAPASTAPKPAAPKPAAAKPAPRPASHSPSKVRDVTKELDLLTKQLGLDMDGGKRKK